MIALHRLLNPESLRCMSLRKKRRSDARKPPTIKPAQPIVGPVLPGNAHTSSQDLRTYGAPEYPDRRSRDIHSTFGSNTSRHQKMCPGIFVKDEKNVENPRPAYKRRRRLCLSHAPNAKTAALSRSACIVVVDNPLGSYLEAQIREQRTNSTKDRTPLTCVVKRSYHQT